MTPWWLRKPMRLIQTNLREIDATLDTEAFVRSLKDLHADVVLFNVGGIVANYPTDLAYHFRNPYLNSDLVGEVIDRVHQEGIRFLGRFDFSKLNEIYADQHPEWCYRSVKGERINYNGQVHTCINGYYQQTYALQILAEALDRYPLDGVFFNMIGYVATDYNHVYHGICQCQNCQQRFGEMYGLDLPIVEDSNDPVFLKYQVFKRHTSRELFLRIRDLVKGVNPGAALCTYTHEGIDIYRSESNSGIGRSQPEWVYSASENVKLVRGSWEKKAIANAAVHFIDFPFRHAAVSPQLTRRRLAQNLANGGWMDYYVIGHLSNQDDRLAFEGVKALFDFHKRNEDHYTGIRPVADVALAYPAQNAGLGAMEEFRGIFKMLSEAHVLFDVLHDSILESATGERLEAYQVLILPDMRMLSAPVQDLVDGYVHAGGRVLATGFSAAHDLEGKPVASVGIRCAGIAGINQRIGYAQGMYLRVRPDDKESLKGFTDLDILPLNGDLLDCALEEGASPYLGYIPPPMFGPPEKCYYVTETDIPGLVASHYGKGRCVYIPWRIGAQYRGFSTHAQPMLLHSALDDLLRLEPSLWTDAPPLVEIQTHRGVSDERLVVNLVNLSGQSGAATLAPVEIRDIQIRVACPGTPSSVRCLWAGRELDFDLPYEGAVRFTVPSLSLLESVVIEVGG